MTCTSGRKVGAWKAVAVLPLPIGPFAAAPPCHCEGRARQFFCDMSAWVLRWSWQQQRWMWSGKVWKASTSHWSIYYTFVLFYHRGQRPLSFFIRLDLLPLYLAPFP